jgi:hypothetical protein
MDLVARSTRGCGFKTCTSAYLEARKLLGLLVLSNRSETEKKKIEKKIRNRKEENRKEDVWSTAESHSVLSVKCRRGICF